MYRHRLLRVSVSISLGLFLLCASALALAQDVQFTTLGGSAAGSPFSDTNCENPVEVRVQAGHWIDGIRLVCADARGNLQALNVRGGSGGSSYVFRLQDGEEIRRITGTAMGSVGPYVYALQIHTNRRSSPRYGEEGSVRGQQSFDLRVPDGHAFVGLSGTAGQYLNGLKIAHRPASSPSLTAGSRSLNSETPATAIFVNQTGRPLSLVWVDYQGAEKPYGIVAAGSKRSQTTYATHVWRLKDGARTVETLTVGRSPDQQRVVAREDPAVIAEQRRKEEAAQRQQETQRQAEAQRAREQQRQQAEAQQRQRPVSVRIRFVNQSQAVLKTYWVPEEGRERAYATIRAGEAANQQTYSGQVWRVKERSTGRLVREHTATRAASQDVLISSEAVAAVLPQPVADNRTAPRGNRSQQPRTVTTENGSVVREQAGQVVRDAAGNVIQNAVGNVPTQGVAGTNVEVVDPFASAQTCWRESYGRGVGTIPTSCGSAENDAGLCYPRCRSGYLSAGPMCWKACPSGFTEVGPVCMKPKAYGRGVGFGYVPVLEGRSDAKAKCERKHGRGNCERKMEMYYPRCKAGYKPYGTNICTPKCPSGFRDNGVGGCERLSYGRGVGTIPSTCGRGQENDGGLCYSGCRSGYNGIGPVCWANQCPAEFPTQCGAGCAKSTQACIESITTQVESSLEMVQNITGIVATGGASTAVMQVPKATIKRQIKRKAQEVGKNLTEAAAENAATVFFDAQLTGEFSWADLDPTGITNVVAAFYKPLCEDFD